MDNLAHETTKNNKATNGKGAWRLSDKERDERRSTADELSQQNERDRDRLRQAQARAAEVKELIKATDLGAEAEELKNEIKHLETSIDARSETVERCLREARTGKTDRQQESLPGVPPAADKAPKAPPPRPSAAERTLALPERASATAGEAQVHEGGELAPEPPRDLPALPPAAAAHPDAIEAEIVDEAAEARARELWRGLALDALEEEGPLPLQPLHAEVDGGCYDKGTVAPDTAQMKALLGVMVASGAIVVDDQERYALPTPPKGSKKKPAKKAAPKAKPQPKKPAKGKKPSKGAKAEAPVLALGDEIDRVLRAWGTWLDVDVLEAKVREDRPLHAQHDGRDWKPLLATMEKQGRIERREENGRTLFRVCGLEPAPVINWRQERKNAVAHIAKHHKEGLPIGGDRGGTPRACVLVYLEAAGALASGSRGWDYELSCDIDDKRVSEGVWRMSLDYLLDQIDENAAANGGVGPTAASLADLLEAPRGLVADLVAELLDLKRLREVPQTLGVPRLAVLPSPKGRKLLEAAE